jgi:hypothetical protein
MLYPTQIAARRDNIVPMLGRALPYPPADHPKHEPHPGIGLFVMTSADPGIAGPRG